MIFENCLWKTSTINERLQKCRNVHGFGHVKAKLKFSCPNRLKFHYRLKSNKKFLWHEKAEILKWLWLSDNHHFVRKLKIWRTFDRRKPEKCDRVGFCGDIIKRANFSVASFGTHLMSTLDLSRIFEHFNFIQIIWKLKKICIENDLITVQVKTWPSSSCRMIYSK